LRGSPPSPATSVPHVNPLYFTYANGHIYLGTCDRTLAALNVNANSAVTVLFNIEREPSDRRVLRVYARARLITEPRACRWYVRRVSFKYFVNWGGFRDTLANARLLYLMHRYHSSGEKGKQCVMEVVPERVEVLNAP